MIGNAGNEKPNKAERLAFTQTDHEKLIEEAERGNRAIEAREHRSLFEAAAREQLIGEAATAILTSEGIEQQEDGTYWGENTWPNAVKDAATAMAVFEKALTPTDADEVISEREALERVLLTSFDYADIDPSVRELADAILAAGFRRSEEPETAPELFPGTLDALDSLTIRKEEA